MLKQISDIEKNLYSSMIKRTMFLLPSENLFDSFRNYLTENGGECSGHKVNEE